MGIAKIFSRMKPTPVWVAGLHALPGEVHYAWFAKDDPEATQDVGVSPNVQEALDRLSEWERARQARFKGVAVNAQGLAALAGTEFADRAVEVTALPWVLHSLEVRAAPRVAAVVDRRNVAAGVRADGTSWTCGDWSDAYSRTGSVGSIVLRAAAVLAEVLDGRSQPSGLRTTLPSAVGRSSPESFLQWVDNESAADVSGSLRVLDAITAAARSGDLVADRLVNLIASDIGRTIAACIEQLSLQAEKLQVVIGGRVLERMPTLRPGIVHRVQVSNPSVHIETVTPVQPALALARALAESGRLDKG